MIEFIISILVPILGGLGVSEADVTTYVTMLMCGKVTHNNLIGSSSPIPSARYSYF